MSDEIDSRCVTHHLACECREAAFAKLREVYDAAMALYDFKTLCCGFRWPEGCGVQQEADLYKACHRAKEGK